ncbi:nitronate monooxygenase [Novosphingobium sp.]|jgi:nitronate monooxygenase|uniref:nitronate monooxygenase n=1 Tax=Novosphingobium sp. TaxID=1874826 RepID=UPI0022CCD0F9|nr:nitronate monooxygenase [Novosphingobium sp.]MCZ8019661.1 nitronate monooxygenase [Novosphingobium sp.]MCZ8035476.1 nitronate monooxygenase [Novosphingobium sp.]MCZ8050790.1 nitronate monooxygenase [Novosphingobium sp.]MCZ8059136.1 nitronate monooxygenase [Novosphingobium sp.]MCZ8232582.1 nitronate monooxygenase [Novosphingobium sp.]
MAIETRLTREWGLDLPIMLAPMALAGGGELAAACAEAGAFGLVGGGYGELDWTRREWGLATQRLANTAAAQRVGCGFITWKLDQDASALDWVLDQPLAPKAVFLSFGDPRPYAARIAASGARLVCQVQRLDQVPQAVEAGAALIVAQGGAAGGHGAAAATARSTMVFVPEVADWLAVNAPQVLLLGAGGIADGRGLAALLMLGADGALIGSRLWASAEALPAAAAKAQAVAADGDATARSPIFDVLRRKDWPAEYDFRALRNALHREWEGREAELRADPAAARAAFDAAVAAGDFAGANVTVGEAVGLIRDVPGASEVLRRICVEADERLASAAAFRHA